MTATNIEIPNDLLPADGRFGSGPARIRPAQIEALTSAATEVLGTSHRQAPVKNLVGRIRSGLADLFSLPEGYEVVLGNGGSTVFWDVAAFGLVRERAAHATFGEFGQKFAKATDTAPHLKSSLILGAEPGTAAIPPEAWRRRSRLPAGRHRESAADVFAWPTMRPRPVWPPRSTSGRNRRGCPRRHRRLRRRRAGRRIAETDVSTSPAEEHGLRRRPMGSDHVARAIARAQEIKDSGRWIPTSLDLVTAIENSAKDQTYNTPAVATLLLLAEQIEWINGNGGLTWATERTAESSGLVYDWAESAEATHPYVVEPADRSSVVATVDFDESVDAAAVAKVLRANGVVDVEPYRKLGRNQLRIATFVSVDPDDVRALLACIDYVIDALK